MKQKDKIKKENWKIKQLLLNSSTTLSHKFHSMAIKGSRDEP